MTPLTQSTAWCTLQYCQNPFLLQGRCMDKAVQRHILKAANIMLSLHACCHPKQTAIHVSVPMKTMRFGSHPHLRVKRVSERIINDHIVWIHEINLSLSSVWYYNSSVAFQLLVTTRDNLDKMKNICVGM